MKPRVLACRVHDPEARHAAHGPGRQGRRDAGFLRRPLISTGPPLSRRSPAGAARSTSAAWIERPRDALPWPAVVSAEERSAASRPPTTSAKIPPEAVTTSLPRRRRAHGDFVMGEPGGQPSRKPQALLCELQSCRARSRGNGSRVESVELSPASAESRSTSAAMIARTVASKQPPASAGRIPRRASQSRTAWVVPAGNTVRVEEVVAPADGLTPEDPAHTPRRSAPHRHVAEPGARP